MRDCTASPIPEEGPVYAVSLAGQRERRSCVATRSLSLCLSPQISFVASDGRQREENAAFPGQAELVSSLRSAALLQPYLSCCEVL